MSVIRQSGGSGDQAQKAPFARSLRVHATLAAGP